MPEDELALLAQGPQATTSRADTAEATAVAIFRDNAGVCAEIIVDIAVHGENERTRLAASKYVVDRVLGRIPEAAPVNGPSDPLQALFGSVLREPTAQERQAGAKVSRLSS
jgi:hypothetical protein